MGSNRQARRFEYWRAIPHLPPTLRYGAAGSPLRLRKGEAINATPLGLMRSGCALLSVIIVHYQASVNDSWNPTKQRQNNAEKETGNTAGHEHSQRRKNHAEKISQRFHLFLFLACRAVGRRGDRRRVTAETTGTLGIPALTERRYSDEL
jgi:hypothetical protein